MNLTEFIERYGDAMAEQTRRRFPPKFHAADAPRLPYLLRRPIGMQAIAIGGAVQSLEESNNALVCGEMGTGKTYIAISTAVARGYGKMLVLCPPHLTEKWKREIEQTVPAPVRAVIVKRTSDLESVRQEYVPKNGPLFVIMSREMAKLSYFWGAAFRTQRVENKEQGRSYQLRCPNLKCHSAIMDQKGKLISDKQLAKKRHFCVNCSEPLWGAKAGQSRIDLATYVKQRMRKWFDLLIVDEVHEYKARDSAQGLAAGTLASQCKATLALTGTLMGGYASTLFYLLYRFSPAIREEFDFTDVLQFVRQYGFMEQVTSTGEDKETNLDGRNSARRSASVRYKEIPGLLPSALMHLIGATVFIRLSDVAQDLPPYKESISVCHLDTAIDMNVGFSQATAYSLLYEEVKSHLVSQLISGKKSFLSTYLQTLLAYPETAIHGEDVKDLETGKMVIQMPPLESSRTYPKENRLVELIKLEKAAGRRVLVFATHTNTRDVTGRLVNILGQHRLRASVLRSSVKPEKREAWVEAEVKRGCDAIICHPKLVQTGLDLLDFPTICWYETDYSVYTMRQASRRSWRIGQTAPVQVIYMAYLETLQAQALTLVSRKVKSSLLVEGELPEGELSGYGESDDTMLMLARSIANNTSDTSDVDPADVERLLADAQEADLFLAPEGWGGTDEQIPKSSAAVVAEEDTPDMSLSERMEVGEARIPNLIDLAEYMTRQKKAVPGHNREMKLPNKKRKMMRLFD